MAEDTYTTRLNLIKPDPQGYIDVNKLNTNFDRIDNSYGGIPVFPSKAARNSAFAAAPFAWCKVGPDVDNGVLCARQNGKWVQMTPTAPVASGLNWGPVGTDWQVTSYALQRLGGGLAAINTVTQYSGAQVNPSSGGNITDIPDICFLPSAWLPDPVWGSWYPIWVGRPGTYTWGGRFNLDGRFVLWALGVGSSLNPGDNVYWQGIYMLDNKDML